MKLTSRQRRERRKWNRQRRNYMAAVNAGLVTREAFSISICYFGVERITPPIRPSRYVWRKD